MAKQAMWVPGYVAQVEIPGNSRLRLVNGVAWTDVTGLKVGYGAIFRGIGGQGNWFHFAIPTPVITDDKRVRLDRAFVLYNADAGARVESAHIWDGPNNVRRYDGLSNTGNHGSGIDAANSWAGGGGNVFWGIGISIFVRFTNDANIHFTTAGADFIS